MVSAASDLIDHLLNGAVADFPPFRSLNALLVTNNFADIKITVGVAILYGRALLDPRQPRL